MGAPSPSERTALCCLGLAVRLDHFKAVVLTPERDETHLLSVGRSAFSWCAN